MIDLFWDMHQQRRIIDNELTARDAARTAEPGARKLYELEDRIDKLTMICHAQWELLKERVSATDDELIERVRQVDLIDGVEDGRARFKPVECGDCGRTISPRHLRCIYCGAESDDTPPFESTLR